MYEDAIDLDDSSYLVWGNLGYAYQFGVAPEKAENALANCVTEEDLQAAVLSAGRKLQSKYKNSREKLQNALYRRGFSTREIKYFLENTDV